MVKPPQIIPSCGPNLPWASFRTDVKTTTPVDYAVWAEATSTNLSHQYASFSQQTEAFILWTGDWKVSKRRLPPGQSLKPPGRSTPGKVRAHGRCVFLGRNQVQGPGAFHAQQKGQG
eukprot:9475075-Pyramimonas_sp.AAC.1